MVEYISFELCKADGDSKYIKIFERSGEYYLELKSGVNGIYIIDRKNIDVDINLYCCPRYSVKLISSLLESLKIYGWSKTIPSDYVPSNRIIGSDDGTWTLDYKERGKKTMRHIRGKGEFPKEEPYISFYRLFINAIPSEEVKEWFLEGYEAESK